MDDEFKLCWKNFQDNIASGFQNLYDRGDLVDVTLACDGKLLHAHKIVLAICSPYFQEIFNTNPCKHPIIILKDVTFNIMCELLEFMYQGVVNVKHTELQSFMKIGQLLQIKGLATNASSSSTGSSSSDKSASQLHHSATDDAANTCGDTLSNNGASTKNNNNTNANASGECNNIDSLTNSSSKLANLTSVKSHSPPSSPSPMAFAGGLNQPAFKSSPDSSNVPPHHSFHSSGNASGSSLKRHSDLNSDALSVYSHKHFRRSLPPLEHGGDHSDSAEGAGLDSVNAEDYFLSSIPHIASNTTAAAAAALRNTFNPAAFGFDYNLYKNTANVGAGLGAGSSGAANTGGGGGSGGGGNSTASAEYPNELHMPNDYSKGFANHMEIPPNSSNVVMLSSTSLLHGNCVFNRNNTVATQQGMKTYWLCKSYRISMCRARCITHQGRVISATGVHNHPPHMRGNGGAGGMGNGALSGASAGAVGAGSLASTGSGSSNYTIDVIASQQLSGSFSANLPVAPNLTVTNMSAAMLPGGTSLNAVNSAGRLHHSSSVSAQIFQQHNMSAGGGGAQQQQQTHPHIGGSIPSPPPLTGSVTQEHGQGHLQQATTNMPTSQHSGMSASGQNSLHNNHHLHSIGGIGSNAMPLSVGSGPGSLQGQHSVIQNMIHPNANSMMHHHHHHHPHSMSHISPMLSSSDQHQQQQEHSPNLNVEPSPHQHQHQHHQQQTQHQQQPAQHQSQSNLEITPLLRSSSPLHLHSPPNRHSSNQSQHGNSLSSPITPTAATSTGGALKSPARTSLSGEAAACSSRLPEQHVLVDNAALSPSEINSSTAASVGTTDVSTSSQSADGAHEAHHQAHVIDSITISPSDGHNFKIEDM